MKEEVLNKLESEGISLKSWASMEKAVLFSSEKAEEISTRSSTVVHSSNETETWSESIFLMLISFERKNSTVSFALY